ncbi:MAG: (2Fe-2S)-binding protein [Burkholderiaceae bacterium]
MKKLRVNGSEHRVDAADDVPLMYVLRNDLGLKSVRFGCGSGQCGACRVLIDGRALASCDTPLWAALDKSITTVEGLGSPQAPHPLQTAFIDLQAAQCGYCTSGLLITAAALLAANPSPTAIEVRQALDANLCRCGAHNRVVRAVLKAAQVMR